MSFDFFRGRSTGKLSAVNTLSPSSMFWFLLAVLRAQYASDEPAKFKKRVKIETLNARDGIEYTGHLALNYILEVLMNIDEKTSMRVLKSSEGRTKRQRVY